MQQDSDHNDTSPDILIYDIISDNFIEDLKSEKVLQLPIPTIYNILNEYEKTHGRQQHQKEILDFLFKCLDKYGRDASPLFQFVDFNSDNIDYYKRLIANYSNIVDFQYLNKSFINMACQIHTEYNIIKKENEQLKSEITSLTEAKEKIDQENDELTKKKIEHEKKNDQLTKLNDELQKKLQNESFEIGDIVCASKDLSKDESWLECNGKNFSQNE